MMKFKRKNSSFWIYPNLILIFFTGIIFSLRIDNDVNITDKPSSSSSSFDVEQNEQNIVGNITIQKIYSSNSYPPDFMSDHVRFFHFFFINFIINFKFFFFKDS